jgi:hypothetical protein
MADWYVDPTGSDSNAGTSTGAPFATLAHAFGAGASGDTFHLNGTFTTTVSLTGAAGPPSGTAAHKTRVVGTASGWSGGNATVNSSTAGVYVFDTIDYIDIENVTVDCNNTAARCFRFNASTGVNIIGCVAKRFTDYGVLLQDSNLFVFGEITGGTSAATYGCYLGGGAILYSYLHANACTQIGVPVVFGEISHNIISGATGSGHDGIEVASGIPVCITHNTIYNNARDGVHFDADSSIAKTIVYFNIISSNAVYDIRSAGATNQPWASIDYNAFYTTGTGARNNVPAGPHDITLSGIPFTNAAGGDFSLNSTAGGGAACQNISLTFTGSSSIAKIHLGAVAPTAGGGGSSGGLLVAPGMTGGWE